MARSSSSSRQCFWCDRPADARLLCKFHEDELRCEASITPEQITSEPPDVPSATLIDCFGVGHAVGAEARVGRSAASSSVTIMHHSISSAHAELSLGDRDEVRDAGSLNGTYVNGEVVGERSPLFDGDVVQFGEIAFFFTMRVGSFRPRPKTMPGLTMPVMGPSLPFVARIDLAGEQVELVEVPPGGIIRGRVGEVRFSRMEFSLLRSLSEQQRMQSEAAFVPWAELTRDLEFRSIDAGVDNVRELVKRVRRKARSGGVTGLIASGAGPAYRLGGRVSG